jgi:UDP-N-acetylglucosamine acyltransferase
MTIHPTAIVSPDAKLADDIEIGPGVIIGPRVEIGSRCVLQARAVIESDTTLGDGNTIGYGAVIGAAPQDYAHSEALRSSVVIGDNNRIREYATIHRGTKEGTATRIGDGCFLMVGVHVGHNCEVGNGAIITNNVLLAGYVQVGERAVLGGGAVFHQFLRIGRLAMVAGGSRFNKDIPPFTIADSYNKIHGINSIGLKRAGFDGPARLEIKRAFSWVFRSNKPFRAAAAEALTSEWRPEARELLEFVLSSKRGVCAAYGPRSDSEEDGAT